MTAGELIAKLKHLNPGRRPAASTASGASQELETLGARQQLIRS
jgi:hypothetical protein